MIISKCYVHTDKQGRELPAHGLELFNLSGYEGEVRNFASGGIGPHWHKELELFYMDKGSVKIGIKDKSLMIEQGQFCFINRNILHSFYCVPDKESCYKSFVFDSSIISGMPGSIFDSTYVRPLVENGPDSILISSADDFYQDFYSIFSEVFKACKEEKEGYEFDVRNGLSKLLLLCKNKASIKNKSRINTIQEDRIKHLIAWIDEHLDEKITIEQLSQEINVCDRECQRLFKQFLHYRPLEYVRRKKIIAAAELISTTDKPITEIAMNYGFESPSYFGKAFLEIIGTSPSSYRSAHYEKSES